MPVVMPFDPDYYDPLPPPEYNRSPSGSGAFPGGQQSIFWPRPLPVQNKANPDSSFSYREYMEGKRPADEPFDFDKVIKESGGYPENFLDLTAWRYRHDPYHVPNFLANLRPPEDEMEPAFGRDARLNQPERMLEDQGIYAGRRPSNSNQYLTDQGVVSAIRDRDVVILPPSEADTTLFPVRVPKYADDRETVDRLYRSADLEKGRDVVVRPEEGGFITPKFYNSLNSIQPYSVPMNWRDAQGNERSWFDKAMGW